MEDKAYKLDMEESDQRIQQCVVFMAVQAVGNPQPESGGRQDIRTQQFLLRLPGTPSPQQVHEEGGKLSQQLHKYSEGSTRDSNCASWKIVARKEDLGGAAKYLSES